MPRVTAHSVTKPRGVCLRPAAQKAAALSRTVVVSQSAVIWRAKRTRAKGRAVRARSRQRSRKTCCMAAPYCRRKSRGYYILTLHSEQREPYQVRKVIKYLLIDYRHFCCLWLTIANKIGRASCRERV